MFCTPLVVTKTAAAAFHDKLILFVCCASLRFHTRNLHSYSKTLAFIVSSADTVVKCWHLSSIIYNYGKFCDDFKYTLKLGAYNGLHLKPHLFRIYSGISAGKVELLINRFLFFFPDKNSPSFKTEARISMTYLIFNFLQ